MVTQIFRSRVSTLLKNRQCLLKINYQFSDFMMRLGKVKDLNHLFIAPRSSSPDDALMCDCFSGTTNLQVIRTPILRLRLAILTTEPGKRIRPLRTNLDSDCSASPHVQLINISQR